MANSAAARRGRVTPRPVPSGSFRRVAWSGGSADHTGVQPQSSSTGSEPGTSASGSHFAARCLYLQMTFGGPPDHGLVNICHHIIRDGSPCVGPFLDDAETPCGLWELKPAGLLRGFEPTPGA